MEEENNYSRYQYEHKEGSYSFSWYLRTLMGLEVGKPGKTPSDVLDLTDCLYLILGKVCDIECEFSWGKQTFGAYLKDRYANNFEKQKLTAFFILEDLSSLRKAWRINNTDEIIKNLEALEKNYDYVSLERLVYGAQSHPDVVKCKKLVEHLQCLRTYSEKATCLFIYAMRPDAYIHFKKNMNTCFGDIFEDKIAIYKAIDQKVVKQEETITNIQDNLDNVIKNAAIPKEFSGNIGDNIQWRFNDDILYIHGTGTLCCSEVYQYGYRSDELILIDEKTVVSLFQGYIKERTKKLYIMGDFETIDDGCFANFYNLETVYIPSGIKKIMYGAFYNCISLKEIDLTYVEHIGYNAFRNCIKIEEITLDTCEYIGDNAFYGCESLREFSCDNMSGTTISEYAFGKCTNIQNMKIHHIDILKNGAFLDAKIENMYIGFKGIFKHGFCNISSIDASHLTVCSHGILSFLETDTFLHYKPQKPNILHLEFIPAHVSKVYQDTTIYIPQCRNIIDVISLILLKIQKVHFLTECSDEDYEKAIPPSKVDRTMFKGSVLMLSVLLMAIINLIAGDYHLYNQDVKSIIFYVIKFLFLMYVIPADLACLYVEKQNFFNNINFKGRCLIEGMIVTSIFITVFYIVRYTLYFPSIIGLLKELHATGPDIICNSIIFNMINLFKSRKKILIIEWIFIFFTVSVIDYIKYWILKIGNSLDVFENNK